MGEAREVAAAEFDAAEWIARGRWLARLARELAHEGDAEDVAQEAWRVALERRPRPGPGLGAWCRGVVANVARRRRAREAQRRGVERRGARDEAVEGPDESVARLEIQRVVADAVLALDEPYRTAVLLRHQEGLGAVEIARRTGATPAAVRQRVARGLAMLRARLDGRFGTRGAWCAAFAGACGALRAEAAVPSATAMTVGGVAMASKTVLVSLGVAACVAGAAWFAAPALVGGNAVERDTARVAVDRLADGGERTHGIALSPERAIATAPETAAERRALAPPVAAATAFAGRVVDRVGRPVREASVALLDAAGATLAEAACDADGRFALAGAGGASLVARHGAYLPAVAELPVDGEVELVLRARPIVEARLFDAAGAPATGPSRVEARVVPEGARDEERIALDLHPDGVWRSSGAPVGKLVAIEARTRGFARTERRLERELVPDAVVAVDVELGRGFTLAGRVLDRATGAPIAGATVWAESHTPEEDDPCPVATTELDGAFVLRGLEPPERVAAEGTTMHLFWLGARAEGYASTSFQPMFVDGAAPQRVEVLLDAATASLELRVTRADGTPARTIWAYGSDERRALLFSATDDDGVMRFAHLAPGEVSIALHAPQSLHEEAGLPPDGSYARVDLELAANEHRVVDVVLGAPAAFRGRLTDPAGRPLAGVTVIAQLEHRGVGMGFPLWRLELVTDEDGAFGCDAVPACGLSLDLRDDALVPRPPHEVAQLVAGAAIQRDLVAAHGVHFTGTVAGDPDGVEREWRLRLVDPATGEDVETQTGRGPSPFRFGPLYPRPLEVVLERDGVEVDRAPVGQRGAGRLVLGG